jgi:hypothetical protein
MPEEGLWIDNECLAIAVFCWKTERIYCSDSRHGNQKKSFLMCSSLDSLWMRVLASTFLFGILALFPILVVFVSIEKKELW